MLRLKILPVKTSLTEDYWRHATIRVIPVTDEFEIVTGTPRLHSLLVPGMGPTVLFDDDRTRISFRR
jgi:hypothetical protein